MSIKVNVNEQVQCTLSVISLMSSDQVGDGKHQSSCTATSQLHHQKTRTI